MTRWTIVVLVLLVGTLLPGCRVHHRAPSMGRALSVALPAADARGVAVPRPASVAVARVTSDARETMDEPIGLSVGGAVARVVDLGTFEAGRDAGDAIRSARALASRHGADMLLVYGMHSWTEETDALGGLNLLALGLLPTVAAESSVTVDWAWVDVASGAVVWRDRFDEDAVQPANWHTSDRASRAAHERAQRRAAARLGEAARDALERLPVAGRGGPSTWTPVHTMPTRRGEPWRGEASGNGASPRWSRVE